MVMEAEKARCACSRGGMVKAIMVKELGVGTLLKYVCRKNPLKFE